MAVSDEFLEYVLDQLSAWEGVSARRMFGGAGLYREGRMFGLVADDVAYLKVDDSNRERFLAAGSSQFRPFPDRKSVMPYYEIPPDILEDTEELIAWAEESLRISDSTK